MRAIASLFPIVFLWIVIGVTLGKAAGKGRKNQAPKTPSPAPKSQVPTAQVREMPRQVSRPSNAGVGHVRTIGMDTQAKLEQLETLKNAGLLDQEEYNEKKRKILGK